MPMNLLSLAVVATFFEASDVVRSTKSRARLSIPKDTRTDPDHRQRGDGEEAKPAFDSQHSGKSQIAFNCRNSTIPEASC